MATWCKCWCIRGCRAMVTIDRPISWNGILDLLAEYPCFATGQQIINYSQKKLENRKFCENKKIWSGSIAVLVFIFLNQWHVATSHGNSVNDTDPIFNRWIQLWSYGQKHQNSFHHTCSVFRNLEIYTMCNFYLPNSKYLIFHLFFWFVTF
jgi:hypothetical protein